MFFDAETQRRRVSAEKILNVKAARGALGVCFVGRPILAAAGFQPALFVSRFVGFCRKRRSRQESSVARVNALRSNVFSLRSPRLCASASKS